MGSLRRHSGACKIQNSAKYRRDSLSSAPESEESSKTKKEDEAIIVKDTSRKFPLNRNNACLHRSGYYQGCRRSLGLQENNSSLVEETFKLKMEDEVRNTKENGRKRLLTKSNSSLPKIGTYLDCKQSLSLQEKCSSGAEETNKLTIETEIMNTKENGKKRLLTKINSTLSKNGTNHGYRGAFNLQENSDTVFRESNSCCHEDSSINLMDTSVVRSSGTKSQYQSRGFLKVSEKNTVSARNRNFQCHKGRLPSSKLRSSYSIENSTIDINKAFKIPFMNSSQLRIDTSGSAIDKTKKQRVGQLNKEQYFSNLSPSSNSSVPSDDLEFDLISSISSGMCDKELQDLNLLPYEFWPEKWVGAPFIRPDKSQTVAEGEFQAFDGSRYTPIQEASIVLNSSIADACARDADEEAETSSEYIDLFESLQALEMSGNACTDILQIQDGNADSMLALEFSCLQFCDPWDKDVKSTSEELTSDDKYTLEGSISGDSCLTCSSFESLPTQDYLGLCPGERNYQFHNQVCNGVASPDFGECMLGKISRGMDSLFFENEANKIADELIASAAQSSENSNSASIDGESISIFELEQSLMQLDELNVFRSEDLLFFPVTMNSRLYEENNLESSLGNIRSGAGQPKIEKETSFKDKLHDFKNEYSTMQSRNARSFQHFAHYPMYSESKYRDQLLLSTTGSNVNSNVCMKSVNDRLKLTNETFFNFLDLQTRCFGTNEDLIEVLVGMKEFDGQGGLQKPTSEVISLLCKSDSRENFYNVDCSPVLHILPKKGSIYKKFDKTGEKICSQHFRSSLNKFSEATEINNSCNALLMPLKPAGLSFAGDQDVGSKDYWQWQYGKQNHNNKEYSRESILKDTFQISSTENRKSESDKNGQRQKGYLFEQESGVEGHNRRVQCESGLTIGSSGNYMPREKQLDSPQSLNWSSISPFHWLVKIGCCFVSYKNDISVLYWMRELHQKQSFIQDILNCGMPSVKPAYSGKNIYTAVETCNSLRYCSGFEHTSCTGKFDIIPIQYRECGGWTHDFEKYIEQFLHLKKTGCHGVPRNPITIETENRETFQGRSIKISLGVNFHDSSCFLIYVNAYEKDGYNSDQSCQDHFTDSSYKQSIECLRKCKADKHPLEFIYNRNEIKLCHAEYEQNVNDGTKNEVFVLGNDPSYIIINCIQCDDGHILELSGRPELREDLSSSDQIEIQDRQLNHLQIWESDTTKEVDFIDNTSACGCNDGEILDDNLHGTIQYSETRAGNLSEKSSCKFFGLNRSHGCEEFQGLQMKTRYSATKDSPNLYHNNWDSLAGVDYEKIDTAIPSSEKGRTKEAISSGLFNGPRCNNISSQDNSNRILHEEMSGIDVEEIKVVTHIHHNDSPKFAPKSVNVPSLAGSEDILLSRHWLLESGNSKEPFEYNSQYIKGLSEIKEDDMEKKVEMLESELLEVKKQNDKMESLLKCIFRRTDIIQQCLQHRKRRWHRRHLICKFTIRLRRKRCTVADAREE